MKDLNTCVSKCLGKTLSLCSLHSIMLFVAVPTGACNCSFKTVTPIQDFIKMLATNYDLLAAQTVGKKDQEGGEPQQEMAAEHQD